MVLHSTKQSIDNNKVSALAILEIVLSVALYWGIAVYFDTYMHLMISIAIAPLLLLRSQQSTELGLKIYLSGLNFLGLTEANFLGSLVKFFAITGFYLYILILVMQNFIGLDIFPIIILSIVLVIIFVSIMMYSIACKKLNEDNLFGMLIMIPMLFLKMINIFIISLYAKTLGTCRYIGYGYKNILTNWYSLNFLIDMYKPPEILPGIEETYFSKDFAKLSNLKKYIISENNYIHKWLLKIIYSSIYLVSIFYRISIKSTFWFYIPLLLLVKTPSNLNGKPNKIGEFLFKLYGTYFAIIRLIMALVIIIAFIITHFNHYTFSEVSTPFSSILAILYFDFSSLEILKIVQLLIAIITIVLFLWSNQIRSPKVHSNIELEMNIVLHFIFFTNNTRNTLSFFYFLFALIYMMFYFKIWEYKYLPNILQEWLLFLVSIIRYTPFLN